MTGFSLQTFGGKAPKIYSRLLPNDMATVATNVRLDTGRLEPWKGNASSSINATSPTNFTQLGVKTIFKHSSNIWIAVDQVVDILESPIAEDPHNRIYYSGFDIGGFSNPLMQIADQVDDNIFFRLGIPLAPNLATTPTLTPTSSSVSATETPSARSYIYTFVSAFGEEGQPSTAQTNQILSVFSDQTVTITFPVAPSGQHKLAKRRLYRTDADGTFRQVADIDIPLDSDGNIDESSSNLTTFVDDKTDSELGEPNETADFDPPPDSDATAHPEGHMEGLKSMNNGVFAGFAGKTVLFSVPFQPHAFPKKFQLTVQSPVVGLAPLSNGLMVLTKGKPVLVQGTDPASMAMVEIDSAQSCVSRRSIVDMGDFSVYASPDGLVLASESGVELITEQIFTRDQWQALSPSSIHAYYWEGHYIGFYKISNTEKGGFVFDPRGGKNSFVDLSFYADAGFSDLENDELYLVVNNNFVEFASGSNLSYTWKSKEFYNARPINPAVAQVECDSYSPSVTFKLFADNSLKHTQTVTSADPFKLPSGYKENAFHVEVTGSVPINQIKVFESSEEIGNG